MPRGSAEPGTWHQPRAHRRVVRARRCAASRPTTSTCTSCTARRWSCPRTRRSPRSPSSSTRARCATSAARRIPAWMVMEALCVADRNHRPGVRDRAAPLQPARPSHRERAAPALPDARARRAALVAARRRASSPAATTTPTVSPTTRAPPDAPSSKTRVTPGPSRWQASSPALAAERGLTTLPARPRLGEGPARRHRPRSSGPRTRAQLDEALAVLERPLDDEARSACDALVPPGQRRRRLLQHVGLDAGAGHLSAAGLGAADMAFDPIVAATTRLAEHREPVFVHDEDRRHGRRVPARRAPGPARPAPERPRHPLRRRRLGRLRLLRRRASPSARRPRISTGSPATGCS